ncbi:MAG: Cytidylate kinase [Planctomycetota bacterium]|jgi:cytidylate kinase
MPHFVITIDGPAGAGKSTIARELAKRLGWYMLDTGSMYRVVTWAAMESNIELADPVAMGSLAESLDARFESGRAWIGSREISQEIREPEISRQSGFAARSEPVRQTLVQWQKKEAIGRNTVTEGRDQGTIVFPEALVKFFLTADDRERALRRHRELVEKGHQSSLDQVLKDQAERDQRDQENALAPLKPAPDAVIIDSTQKSLEEVLSEMMDIVQTAVEKARVHES